MALALIDPGTIPALACPPAPWVIPITQPDGTTFDAVMFGDEWANGFETTQGCTVVQDKATGFWYYAAVDADGRLVQTDLRPGHDQPQGLDLHSRGTPAFNPNRFDIAPAKAAGTSEPAAYDTNHNGHISANELHIVIVVAGCETSYGGGSTPCTPGLWGHQWAFGGSVAAPIVDGVAVGEYAAGGSYVQFGEWHCRASGNPGHIWYQGWLTPYRVIGSQAGVSIQQAETNPRVIQLLNNPNGVDWSFYGHSGTGEYFLVENRQKVGYDAGLPGCGLLVWHIDETRTDTIDANANDSRRLVDLEEADGLRHLDLNVNYGDAGDVYPGTKNNQAFNDTSNPNSKLYSGATSRAGMANISANCSASMSADLSDLSTVVMDH